MSIPVSISNNRAVAPPGLDPDNGKVKDQDSGNKIKDVDSPASAVAKANASLNSAIVQTSLSVAISSGNDPLALLYKTAIQGINEALEPSMGKDAIQNAATSDDNSAEATADRIVKQSTAFYDQYRQQNKLEDNAETRGKFIDILKGGFEQGFKEAQDVLTSLKALQGDVATGIDKTHELVLKGFADFAAGPKPTVDGQPSAPPALTA
jgi:2-oxoglutarate dehydrogenase complex dehydrogenase (E1) component-like enzyme